MKIPKVAYLIDTHINLNYHLKIAKDYDHIFLAQKKYVDHFKLHNINSVSWLPLGADLSVHGKVSGRKKYDVGFVGSLLDDRRIKLLLQISSKFDFSYKRVFLEKMRNHFVASKIVFNNGINDDLNMRVFEALASGSLLLTDRVDQIDTLFKDGEDLVIYDDKDLLDKIAYYLNNPTKREEIAANGMEKVRKYHTYDHRVDSILEYMRKHFL